MELIELVPFVVFGCVVICSLFAAASLLGEHLGRVSSCYPVAEPDSTPGQLQDAGDARSLL